MGSRSKPCRLTLGPSKPHPPLCSFCGWGLWLEGRSWKGLYRERKNEEEKGKRIKKGWGTGIERRWKSREKEGGPRGLDVGDVCGGPVSIQLYSKHFYQS